MTTLVDRKKQNISVAFSYLKFSLQGEWVYRKCHIDLLCGKFSTNVAQIKSLLAQTLVK